MFFRPFRFDPVRKESGEDSQLGRVPLGTISMYLWPFCFDPVRKKSSKDNKVTKVPLGREKTASTCQARHCGNQAEHSIMYTGPSHWVHAPLKCARCAEADVACTQDHSLATRLLMLGRFSDPYCHACQADSTASGEN